MLEKGGKLRVDLVGVKILSSDILFAFLSVYIGQDSQTSDQKQQC